MKVSCAACQTTYRVAVAVPAGACLRAACPRCRADIFVGDGPSHPELPPPSLRSMAPTLPAPAASPPEQAEEEAPVSHTSRNAWCVDRGSAIDTMSTFELWIAIASGLVPLTSRVWREGMECWTPIAQVPELSCAEVAAPDPRDDAARRAPSSLDPLELVTRLGSDPLAALDLCADDAAAEPPMGSCVVVPTLVAPPDLDRAARTTPAAPPVELPRSGRWPRWSGLARRGRAAGGRWVAVGSAVALGAIGVAASGVAGSPQAGVAPDPASCAALAAAVVVPIPAPADDHATAPPVPLAEPAAQASRLDPPRPEPGQHRLRRGSRP